MNTSREPASQRKSVVKKKFKRQSSLPDQTIQFLLQNDPILKTLQDVKVRNVQQANDSFSAFHKFRQERLIPPMFEKYPSSPTAQLYLKAFYHFFDGWSILNNYTKTSVDTEEDCDQMALAFSCYAFGEMYMQHLFAQFYPPQKTGNLIKEYFLRRPDDTMAMFFEVIFNFNSISTCDNASTYEFQKARIIEGEEFVHKLLSQAELSDLHKCMLIHIYELLGAMYTTTHQSRRALDSFQKCYDLDPANVGALYGIAFQYTGMEGDFKKAVELLKKYIALSPVCDKHYPNAHYILAMVYLVYGKNDREALKYCNLAEEAEKQRLDFLGPVDIDAKQMMQMFKSIMKSKHTIPFENRLPIGW